MPPLKKGRCLAAACNRRHGSARCIWHFVHARGALQGKQVEKSEEELTQSVGLCMIRTEEKKMQCIWMGQAGLLFDFDGTKVMIDPYLSDCVAKVNPANRRRVPVEEKFFDIRPDVLILTHDHLDHTDPETLERILGTHKDILVLASKNAWNHARSFGNGHNYVMFDAGTRWTFKDVTFRAVRAQHSDDSAVGVVIGWNEKHYYVAGDTLWHDRVIQEVNALGLRIDAAFVPVNGVGNNMNMADAADFAQAVGALKTVPVHFGLFDSLDPAADFDAANKIIPTIYKEIRL